MLRGSAVLLLFAWGCGRIGFDLASAGDGSIGAGDDGLASDGPSAASCEGLAPTCGSAGASPCCDSPVVPGGTFYRSYDGIDYNDKGYPATVGTFRLDTYEVTVARFRQFVNAGNGTQQQPPAAGAGAHAAIADSGWDAAWNANLPADTAALRAALACAGTLNTWADVPGSNEVRPMNCLDWYEAFAFCLWDGGYLPSEAEWNYAASGGSEQRAYPWSSPPSSLTIDDSTYASYYVDGTKECMGDGVMGCAVTDLVPVGTLPAGDGAWGQADLGGNIWEWMLDGYTTQYPTATCDNCATAPGSERAVRGGGYRWSGAYLRAARHFDYGLAPTDRYDDVGVRCARAP